MSRFFVLLVFGLLSASSAFAALQPGTYTSLDLYGTPPPLTAQETAYAKYLEGTRKGGVLKMAVREPMELIFPSVFKKGLQQKVMPYFQGYLYESLMQANPMRPSRQIDALIAKSVEADPEHATYIINLRDDVRFSDGTAVTAEDVIFSFKVKVEEISGPPHESYYKELWGTPEFTVLAKDRLQVKLAGVPLGKQRMALFNILADFAIVKPNPVHSAAVEIPFPYLGTGAYAVVRAERDRFQMVRRPDYWRPEAKTLNFDEISLTTYRDKTVEREALKKGSISMVAESDPRAERELDSGVTDGLYKKTEIPDPPDQVMSNVLVMNLDREYMKDPRFRKALALAVDVEGPKMILFAGKLSALASPGEQSRLSPKELPSDAVKALLGDEPDTAEARTLPYEDMGYASIAKFHDRRERLREAAKLLREAGYVIDPVSLRLMKNGRPVELILLEYFEDSFRGFYSFFKNDLARLGIALTLREVPDSTAFLAESRKNTYDLVKHQLDIPHGFEVLDADVLEQKLHSKFAASQFINNSAHLRSPAVDKVLDLLHTLDADSPEYPVAVDALLRLLSAKMPFLLIGERTDVAVFADPKLCFPPNTNGLFESAYYCR